MGLHVLTLRVWLPRISAMEIVSAEMSYQRWAPDTFDSAGFDLLRISMMEIVRLEASDQRWVPDILDSSQVANPMLLQSIAFPRSFGYPGLQDIRS